MTKEKEKKEAIRLFEFGVKLKDIKEQTGLSFMTLNRMGLSKEKSLEIQKRLIELGRLKGLTIEQVSIEMKKPEKTIKQVFRKKSKEEEEGLKQPIETTTKKLPVLKVVPGYGKKDTKPTTDVKLEKERVKASEKVKRQLLKSEEDIKESYLSMYPKVFDLWTYVVDKMKRKYVWTTEDSLFASSTLNIPFVQFQPAKRIYLVSKSLFNWKAEKDGIYKPFSNFVKLKNPDNPLFQVQRHDVDTINVSVGLPSNKRDIEITKEDSSIISLGCAKRLNFMFIKDILFQIPETRVFPERSYIREGEILGEDINGNEFVSLYNGILNITHEKLIKGTKKKIISGSIRIERDIQVGDKLTGLTGLKVTIGEIRKDMDTDIIISEKQIWSDIKEDGQRGGLVKELLSCGKIMVGLRIDTLIENQATRNKGGSLSSTLYPVLNLYDEELVKSIVRDNSRFDELLKTLHLKYDHNLKKFTLLSEKEIDIDDERWVKYPHYLYTQLEFERCYGDTKPDNPINMVGIDFEKKETVRLSVDISKIKYHKIKPTRYCKWDYCYNPSFLPIGYLTKERGLKEVELFKPLGEEIENTIEGRIKEGRGKFPHGISPRRSEAQMKKDEFTQPPIIKEIEKQVFCDIRNGIHLIAIPQVDFKEDEIEINNINNFGVLYNNENYCIVTREPIVSKDNVWCVKIRHNPNLNLGVVKIGLKLIKKMSADYDGDRISLLPYYSDKFLLKEEKVEKLPKMTRKERKEQHKLEGTTTIERISSPFKTITQLLNELKSKLHERTEKELKEEAFVFMNRILDEKRRVGHFGGLRKQASFRNAKQLQHDILNEAKKLEVILKSELKSSEWKDELLKSELKLKPLAKTPIYGNTGLSWLFKEKPSKIETQTPSYRRLLDFEVLRFWRYLFMIDINIENEVKNND